MTIVLTISENDYAKYEAYEAVVQDYPLYGHTSGLTKGDIIALAKLLAAQLPNDYSPDTIKV